MPSTPHILIVGSDPALRDEVETALTALDGSASAIQAVGDVRQGLESARRRAPALALVEMGPDLRELKLFAAELAEHSPGTTIAAVFRPDSFGVDVSEAAVLIEALRAGVRDFLRRPVAPNELADLLRRASGTAPKPASAHGRIVSFISNKGGVGKSTLAVNAACGVARRHPGRVLLVDASLQLGVCASLL
ncbi:MAG TPA: AAA family ATPase, partial [Planctomycetaceae bacterium]|nr:AAA family ATPase [Planctomycetaceae bacterium]